jgi:hypothetical protein
MRPPLIFGRFDKGRVFPVPVSWSWPSLVHSYMILDVNSSQPQGTWGLILQSKAAQREAMLLEMNRGRAEEGTLSSDLKDHLMMGVKRELQAGLLMLECKLHKEIQSSSLMLAES